MAGIGMNAFISGLGKFIFKIENADKAILLEAEQNFEKIFRH